MLACEQLVVHLGTFTLGPITAAARSGAITTIVGPNASGKTTLLRALCSLVGTDGCGEVLLDGQARSALTAAQAAASLGYVPQRALSDVPLSVRAVVELGRLRCPAQAGRVDQAVCDLALEPLCDRPLGDLSEGQRQRVHLARVLAQVDANGVLVLDEPTAPLDPDWAQRVWQLLQRFTRGGGTVLASVHDLAAARVAGDDAWLLKEGQLLASGSVETVLETRGLEQLFGIPFEALGASALPMPAWMVSKTVS